MEKLIKENVTRINKLLKAAGDPEFIQITKHNISLAGSKIEIKDDWYRATNSYINHNIVVEPRYYFDLYPLFNTESWNRTSKPKPVSEYEYIYTDWQEGETIGSGMLTLTSKQFKKFEYGKLNKMFIQFMKETYKNVKDKDWWKEDYDKFLANDDDVIHIIVSIHDQDTTANIRHFVYDNLEGDHLDEAMRYLTERVDIADLLNFSY
jgi:hypothetical protein|tara:strand:+ start:937 stop:1557 length:621 start_codon:yes stop_codon:yes gene_type:complete